MKKQFRELNGYRLIWMPEHQKAMTNKNWQGYVYEHIVVAESFLRRPLTKKEVVHHLDGNRSNNRIENLLVLLRCQHTKLHMWLRSGAVGVKGFMMDEHSSRNKKYTCCKICGSTLQAKQRLYCSVACAALGRRVVTHPSLEELREAIDNIGNFEELGRKYKVSGNTVKKWARSYGILT